MTLLNVPLIDIADFRSADVQARRRVASEVALAARDIGFLVITGHGIAPSAIEDAYTASKEFFRQDLAQKLQVARPDPSHIRGYSGMGTESLSQLEDDPAPPDLKELFDVGPSDIPADDPYYQPAAAGATFAPNVWPGSVTAFRPALTALFETMNEVAQLLSQIFAVGLDLQPDFFFPQDRQAHEHSARELLPSPGPGSAPAPDTRRCAFGLHGLHDPLAGGRRFGRVAGAQQGG